MPSSYCIPIRDYSLELVDEAIKRYSAPDVTFEKEKDILKVSCSDLDFDIEVYGMDMKKWLQVNASERVLPGERLEEEGQVYDKSKLDDTAGVAIVEDPIVKVAVDLSDYPLEIKELAFKETQFPRGVQQILGDKKVVFWGPKSICSSTAAIFRDHLNHGKSRDEVEGKPTSISKPDVMMCESSTRSSSSSSVMDKDNNIDLFVLQNLAPTELSRSCVDKAIAEFPFFGVDFVVHDKGILLFGCPSRVADCKKIIEKYFQEHLDTTYSMYNSIPPDADFIPSSSRLVSGTSDDIDWLFNYTERKMKNPHHIHICKFVVNNKLSTLVLMGAVDSVDQWFVNVVDVLEEKRGPFGTLRMLRYQEVSMGIRKKMMEQEKEEAVIVPEQHMPSLIVICSHNHPNYTTVRTVYQQFVDNSTFRIQLSFGVADLNTNKITDDLKEDLKLGSQNVIYLRLLTNGVEAVAVSGQDFDSVDSFKKGLATLETLPPITSIDKLTYECQGFSVEIIKSRRIL